MCIPLCGLDSSFSRFKFRQGEVIVKQGDYNKLEAKHYCDFTPGALAHEMNFCLGTFNYDIYHVALFCPHCGLRIALKWASDMPFSKTEQQLELAASCSWPNSLTPPL